MISNPCVWEWSFLPHHQASNASIAAGYPILFSSDTIYMEIASEPTTKEAQSYMTIPPPFGCQTQA